MKKKFIVAVMSLVLFVTGNFAIGGIGSKKAEALSIDYDGDPYTIYYFTDYYATVSYYDLISMPELADFDIVYDCQFVTEQAFYSMVSSGYFDGFDYETCVVIIDIKTFKPDSDVLYNLFYDLQYDQGCITAFVSTYGRSDYSDRTFFNYVDLFVCDWELARLKNFLYNSIYDLHFRRIVALNSNTYLIDGRLVGIEGFWEEDMDTLCDESPFLSYFLDALIDRLNYFEYINNYNYNSYEAIANMLRSHSIKLLVYDENNDDFVDILRWNNYTYYDIQQLMSEVPETQFACAHGFWPLPYDYRQILCNIQDVDEYNLPVYVLTSEPIDYDEMGLIVITDRQLALMYGCEWDDEAAPSLLDGLAECIEEHIFPF